MTWDHRIAPIAATFALLTAGGFAPLPDEPPKSADIERIVSTARQENRVMEHLDYLSNKIGPRLTSSNGLRDACDWAVTQFQSFGIKNARLERWGEFPVGFDRGPWTGRMVAPTSKALTFGTNAWTAGTKGPQRGFAILAPSNDEQLAAVKDKLAGAYILSASTAGSRTTPEFREKRAAAYASAKIAGYVRGTRNDLILTGGNFRRPWEKLPELPAINLVKAEYDEIVALIKDNKPVTLEFDIRNHFKRGPIPLDNVIAEILGTEHPDEFVIIGGHIDTWDGATGTTDNGTGCATTLEAARLLMASGLKPKRTIMFQLWSGEEEGLLGSKAYCKAHPDLMPKISAVIVHDGGTNYLAGIGGTEAQQADLQAVFGAVKELDPAMPFNVTKVAGLRGGGSDHASFLAAGVPGFFWTQRGTAVYNHTHHTQFDNFDAAIPEYQKHSAVIAAIGALGIANLDHLLSRDKMIAPPGARGNGGPGGGGGGPGGRAPRRTLGASLDENVVVEIVGGGAAERGGLVVGDVIFNVGDRSVETSEEIGEALQSPDLEIPVSLIRAGKAIETKLTFTPPPTP